MKVIISHDVDHITAFEHWRDGVLLKFLARTFIEFSLRYISIFEVKARFKELVKNKWNYVDALMKFDADNNVNSTFFIGVNNGKGLSYSIREAKSLIEKIKSKKFEVGVHGICYKNVSCMKKEYETFKDLCNCESFGIRMHYLRLAENTLNALADVGYAFDSTIFALSPPYKVSNMWEFPLSIMDSSLFEGGSHFAKISLEKAQEISINIINKAIDLNLKYITILHHDRLFSDAYRNIKYWYMWLIDFMKRKGFEFVSYSQAIRQMENFHHGL